MMGVDATVMGFLALGLGREDVRPVMLITGSGFGSALAAITSSDLASSDFLSSVLAAVSDLRPKISSAVAALTSSALMTSTSSAGSISFAGSGAFLLRAGLACG